MARLEDLTRGTTAKGIHPGSLIYIVDIQRRGISAIDVNRRASSIRPANPQQE